MSLDLNFKETRYSNERGNLIHKKTQHLRNGFIYHEMNL